jgi:hypothetical protein
MYRVRACRSIPQENGGGVVYNRVEGSSLLITSVFPPFSRTQWSAGEGDSISIKGLQATLNSLGSCLALAIERA